jgi:hypothetical protein
VFTLISNFFNEELLMPDFLRHHKPMFDHGVMIDYGSTDASVKIIRQMCPDWEVVKPVNPIWGVLEVNQEINRIERRTPGWKIHLNTTEFLICGSLDELVKRVRGRAVHATLPVAICDCGEKRIDTPLIIKRFHWGDLNYPKGRLRTMHCMSEARYSAGRHQPFGEPGAGICIAWFAYAPWPECIDRKMQIQFKVPQKDYDKGWCLNHKFTPELLTKIHADLAASSQDLMLVPEYAACINAYLKTYWPGVKV